MTQYPELAEELEEEIKRMEDENKQKQADLDRLQNEISNGSTSENSEPGAAFVRGTGKGSNAVDENNESLLVESAEVADDDILSSTIMDLDEDTEYEEEIQEEDPSSSVETIQQKEDLTLTHLAVESFRVLLKNAQDDVRRIINLAIPVLQPLLNVGDVAWKQMKDWFVKARKAYEAYQATNVPLDEDAEIPETCDDTEYA